MKRNSKGQSVVEIVVALAIFLIIVGSGVVTVLGALSTSRLGEEETQATSLAVEGIEATQAIRNQSWNNLSLGSHGLSKAGGTWVFSGTSDTDPSGRFTRTVNISSVERDASGNIVSTGGIVDPDTLSVSSSVSWDFTAVRQNTVALSTYLTNWQEGINAGGGTPTPTPTPTLTPTPSLTPTPAPISCPAYCASIGYTTGTCRKKPPDCSANAEVYESGGDLWCTGANSKCCCRP